MRCNLSFKEINKEYQIEKKIGKIVRKIENDSKDIKDIPNISNYLIYFLKTPGKRKRLIKLLAVAKLTGGITRDIQRMINALELVNSAIFIHDDVIDHDFERKGRPTLNKLIGYEKTILIGNMLYSLAMKELSRLKCEEDLKREILTDFTNSLFVENAGQYCDVYFRNNFEGMKLKQWEQMVIRHSGTYMISALKAIAKLNGKKEEARFFDKYEKNCTFAGAAEDAIRGFLGNKKPRGDLKNKGFTILVHYALNEEKILSKNYTSKFIEGKINENRAIEKTKEYITKKIQRSLYSLSKIPDSYDKEVLKYLAYQTLEEIK